LPESNWSFTVPDNIFTDSDGDHLTYTATFPTWVSFNSDTLTFTGTPTASDLGDYTIEITASDGDASVSRDFTINVDGLLSASNLRQEINYTEDTLYVLDPIVVNSITETTATVVLTLSNINAGALNTGTSNGVMSTFVNGVWTAVGDILDVNVLLSNLIFTPADDFDSDFTIDVLISDGANPDVSIAMNVTGISVNDLPDIAGTTINISTDEDTPVIITSPLVSDIEDGNIIFTPDNVTFNNVINGADISINTDGKINYQAAENFNGIDTFTYTVTDSDAGNTQEVTVTVDVAAINDAPDLTGAISEQYGREEDLFSYTLPADLFTDAEDDPITYSASLADDSDLPGWLSFDGSTFSGTPPHGSRSSGKSQGITIERYPCRKSGCIS